MGFRAIRHFKWNLNSAGMKTRNKLVVTYEFKFFFRNQIYFANFVNKATRTEQKTRLVKFALSRWKGHERDIRRSRAQMEPRPQCFWFDIGRTKPAFCLAFFLEERSKPVYWYLACGAVCFSPREQLCRVACPLHATIRVFINSKLRFAGCIFLSLSCFIYTAKIQICRLILQTPHAEMEHFHWKHYNTQLARIYKVGSRLF